MHPISHPLPASRHDLHKIALFVIGVAGTVIFAMFQLWHSNLISTGIMLGFGRDVTWTSDLEIPPGHQMTFKDALHILSTKVIVKMIVPEWAKNLTKEISTVHLAFDELEVCHLELFFVPVVRAIDAPHFEQKYMLEMVEARRNGDKAEQRYDLFSGLLDAAEEDLDRTALSDRELVGKYPTSHCFAHPEGSYSLC